LEAKPERTYEHEQTPQRGCAPLVYLHEPKHNQVVLAYRQKDMTQYLICSHFVSPSPVIEYAQSEYKTAPPHEQRKYPNEPMYNNASAINAV
jgi:hypothetical protein